MWHYGTHWRTFLPLRHQIGLKLHQRRKEKQQGVFDKTHKFSAHSSKKRHTFTLDCDCRPFTCKSTQIPRPLPFHNIMEPVETWDNIWRGNGKDNGRLWTTFIPSLSPLSCVWVAAALLNHVWNFWLQRQHTLCVFSLSLRPVQGKSWRLDPREECVTVAHTAHLLSCNNKASFTRLFSRPVGGKKLCTD